MATKAPVTRGKGIKGLLFVTVLVALVAIAMVWQHYASFARAPMTGPATAQRVVVERGNGMPQLLRSLRALGITTGFDIEWQVLARQVGAAGKLQAGEYALKPGMSPSQLLIDIRDGKVVSYRFTIIEGWNIRDLRAALAKAEPLVKTIQDMDDAALMKALGHEGQFAEGRFLPETYRYNTGDTDLAVLKQAYKAMDVALNEAWKSRIENLPFKTRDDALILASIVEKETGLAAERPMIAGVFVRRLQKGMRLETDPTVIYGMGAGYKGNIRKADLQKDTPYNTYTRQGLPPTPIAMPGKDALAAVTRPAAGEAIFFVAAGDGSGRSLFASTYGEHQANVREYLARYRAGNAKGPMTGTATSNPQVDAAPTTAPAAKSGPTKTQ
ncbi:endolytic transglycosylase MltG [Lysobacter sp. HDW10]|uniref:endolytic transglycosylase MltG n=1 Tax=Lysobacter sp. HDW10 TaxID=2714936 RepID=UPI00140A2A97|nr:endolytic transglycosylase MltG [Lysobacter sp. HDW10]QIK81797.1 endolytic transglycosylase MltG [Lysobacter sp. HDW10]